MLECTVWPSALGWIWLASIGQLSGAETVLNPQAISLEVVREAPEIVEVNVSALAIYDQPRLTSYLTDRAKQGDRLQTHRRLPGGWLAIEPPASAIYWIDAGALETPAEADRSGRHFGDPAGGGQATPTRSWVAADRANLRSGHSSAQLPGPPCGSVPKGTMVHLVDRRPIKLRKETTVTTWRAILPPAGVWQYVRADGTRPIQSHPVRPAEKLASYEPADGGPSAVERLDPPQAKQSAVGEQSSEHLPADIAPEVARIDAVHRTILSNQPIEQWRFETVRARYQAILKRADANSSVEEAIRRRLERLTRHEQAAEAARTIQTVLARSHRRDGQVAAVERRLANPGPEHARSYSAEGLVKPSSRMVDGRRLYSLIGSDGRPVAYLDVPPGLDIEPLLTRRVGVRGVSHYNEDLGARLITVRDVDLIETRR
jgi:hypothetical protein